MKNIDKLRQMDVEELIIFINSNKCDRCIYNETNCMHDLCSKGMKEWLNQECELTVDDINREHDKFCCARECATCEYPDDTCHYSFLVDHFNIIDGKITRR